MVEAHSGLTLQTSQLLDQTEAAYVNTIHVDWLDTVDEFVCVYECVHVKLNRKSHGRAFSYV